jgi:hypothetical protein
MQKSQSIFFNFEADFVESLRCIPMQVRYKLDICGIKLKLNQWNQFSALERQGLVDIPCSTAAEIDEYRNFLCCLIKDSTGAEATELPVDPYPLWDRESVPDEVREKAESLGIEIRQEQWLNLTPLQRFALVKLTRSSHENSNFLPALREFNLA